jgi:hypothetical protein
VGIVFTKIQFDKNSAPSEISSGKEPVYNIDGKFYLLLDGKKVEVNVEEEEAIYLDEAEEV